MNRSFLGVYQLNCFSSSELDQIYRQFVATAFFVHTNICSTGDADIWWPF